MARARHSSKPLWHIAINFALAIGFVVPLSLALLGQLQGGFERLGAPGWTWTFIFPVAFTATICAGLIAAAIFELFTVEAIPSTWRDGEKARAVGLAVYALAFLTINPFFVHTGLERAWLSTGQFNAGGAPGADPEQADRDRHARNLARFIDEPWTEEHHARQTQVIINSYLDIDEKIAQDGEWGERTDIGLRSAQARAQGDMDAVDARIRERAAEADRGPPWWIAAAMWAASIIWSLVCSFGRLVYHGTLDRGTDHDAPGVDPHAEPIIREVDGVTYVIAKVWDGVGPKPSLPHPELYWVRNEKTAQGVYVMRRTKRRFANEIAALNASWRR